MKLNTIFFLFTVTLATAQQQGNSVESGHWVMTDGKTYDDVTLLKHDSSTVTVMVGLDQKTLGRNLVPADVEQELKDEDSKAASQKADEAAVNAAIGEREKQSSDDDASQQKLAKMMADAASTQANAVTVIYIAISLIGLFITIVWIIFPFLLFARIKALRADIVNLAGSAATAANNRQQHLANIEFYLSRISSRSVTSTEETPI